MFQRLTSALAQIKTCNISKILLNQVCQITYSLYQVKEITEKNQFNEFNKGTIQIGYYIYEF